MCIAKSTIPQRHKSEEDLVQCELTSSSHYSHVISCCIALHKMMSDDNCTEKFKGVYSQFNSHQQDLATRWLDLGHYTLLYRYICKLIDNA